MVWNRTFAERTCAEGGRPNGKMRLGGNMFHFHVRSESCLDMRHWRSVGAGAGLSDGVFPTLRLGAWQVALAVLSFLA